jgi:glycosyltransferase involved in cell wall biosynthesis
MNILMIGAYKPQVGGPVIVTQELANILKHENKIFIINIEQIGYPKGLGHWKDGEVDVYQERIYFHRRYTSFQTLFQTAKRAFLLRKKVDIYHIHGSNFSGIGSIDKTKPLVLTMHGYSSIEPILKGRFKPNSPQYKFRVWMEKKSIERADAVIAVGEKLKEWIIENLGADSEKVFHISNGVDVNRFKFKLEARKSLRKKLKIGKNKRIILFSKQLNKQNGILNLLEAISIISKQYPNVILLILGDGPLKNEVINYQKNKLPKNILYGGLVPHSQMVDYMSLSDIFVLPSASISKFGKYKIGEVSPLSIREAMACQLPVVATNIGGNKELLEDGRKKMNNDVGCLIPSNEPEDLSNAITYLLEHPNEAEKMGKRAREFIKNNYTWEIMAKRVLNVYKFAMEYHKKRKL